MTTDRPLPIYHLTPASVYYRQPEDQPYQPETLASEGFIHCTAGAVRLVEVANTFFADLQDDLLVLEIDPVPLTAPLVFEPPIPPVGAASAHQEIFAPDLDTLFPHIYGLLNREAIVNCFELRRDLAGKWHMP
jgi:uncharacterized protein (DUF952 family)